MRSFVLSFFSFSFCETVSVQHHINLQHVLYKRIVSMQHIDHRNAIHLNHHFSLHHVQQILIILGIPQSSFSRFKRNLLFFLFRYKTTAAGKNLEIILQKAIQHATLLKQSTLDQSYAFLNGNKHSESPSLSFLPPAKRIKPLNLSISATAEDDSGTASESPTNSLSNDVLSSDIFTKSTSSISSLPVWDESVTEILLTVAKQRDTRMIKINTLRSFLEDKLGVVEFLCLYRGFKSEPKLTFQGTPWEHYQRFLPVLFTLLTLDNTTV